MNKILLFFAILGFHSPSFATVKKRTPEQPPVLAQVATDELGIEDELEDDFSGEQSPPIPENAADKPELTPADEPAAPVPEISEPKVSNSFDEPMRPSAGSGEKIFDWSKYPDAQEVPHPFREKGLIRITKDRTYIYKVDETEQQRAFDFKVGMFNPINLANPETGVTFEENYDQTSNPAFLVNYEWQLWNSPIGKWGLRAGSGAFIAQGHGHFVGTTNAGLVPREVFTFILVPVNLGAVYRMHWGKRQLFVPYAEGGGTVFGFTEMRDDDKPPKFGGSLGAYFAGGLAINLTYFDAVSRIQLDMEYGINTVFLTVEYRQVVSLMKNYDFTSDFINAGFLMEY